MPVTVTIQRPNLVDGDVLDAAALASMTALNVTVSGAVASDEFAAYKTQATNSLNSSVASLVLVPVGAIVPFAGTTVPANWMVCEGQVLLRSSYTALFAAIGTTWGSGTTPSTSFTIPDLRGRTVVGVDNGAQRVAAASFLGQTAGTDKVNLTVAQMPAHNHVVDPAIATTSRSGTHTHSETVPAVPNVSVAGTYDMVMRHVQNDPFNNPSTGGPWLTGSDYNNWQNELDVSVWGARPMVPAGDHAHTVDIPATNTTYVGGGGGHDNMPPYAAIRWIIRVR